MKTCSSCSLTDVSFQKGRNQCVECRKAYMRAYYQTPSGKAAIQKAQRKWFEANKKARKATIQRWNKENQDKVQGSRLARYARDPEGCRAKIRDKLRSLRLHKEAHFLQYRKSRQALERDLVRTLKDRPCQDCGGSFPPCAMDFDHVRGEKKFAVANSTCGGYSLATITAEAGKCDVVCACCHRIRTRANHHVSSSSRRAWLNSLKSDPCTDCGKTFPPEAMDFDHVMGQKTSDISRMYGCRKERIKEELLKCVLVCACCHRIRTEERNGRGRQDRAA